MSSNNLRLSRFSDMTYVSTYYYANLVQNVLHDQFGYLRNLNDFYGEQQHYYFIEPYKRTSVLHSFIHFCISGAIDEDIANTPTSDVRPQDIDRLIKKSEGVDPASFWLDRMLTAHSVAIDGGLHAWAKSNEIVPTEISEDDISDYYQALIEDGSIESLCEKIAKEVFFLLFLNRELLHTFNGMMARQINSEDDEPPDEFKVFFKKPGVLKRSRIPRWVQKAVFFRDRGKCVFCLRDLSGLISIDSQEHYDHIVSLAEGGLNDVTNIQLLCENCNLKKGKKLTGTSSAQELWYSYTEKSR